MEEGEADIQHQLESAEGLFSALRPHCAQLLDLLQTPRKTAPCLPALIRLLRRAPAHLLQSLLDYTLIPLLLLLDAAVECRSGKEGAANGSIRDLRVSDSVAEGVLVCLEELLTKCHLVSVNQIVMVLKKLTKGGMLCPTEASEEFREGIVRCLRAILLNLEPCSIEFCACKGFALSHQLSGDKWSTIECRNNLERCTDSKECLMSFIRSQDASAAVGHWLSLLFQMADVEVERGLCGSAKLRKEALFTLRVLIAKVGNADALAFFLPGVVSRFSKALHDSRNTIVGASGNSDCIYHAVKGLAEFLSIVLRDDASRSSFDSGAKNSNTHEHNNSQSSHSIVEELRRLSSSLQDRSSGSAESEENPSSANIATKKDAEDKISYTNTKFTVNRTKSWIKETVVHVDKFLSATFPHLCVHSSEKVRKGVLDAMVLLLINCPLTLRCSKFTLLEGLCTLICDDLETVSSAAQDALFSLMTSSDIFTQNEIAEVFNRLVQNLPKVILRSEETVATSHALKLFGLMFYIGPGQLVSSILSSPMKVGHLLDVVALCMGPHSQFSGPIRGVLSSESLKVGYLHSISELKACSVAGNADQNATSDTSRISLAIINDSRTVSGTGDYTIPSIPPWCINAGSKKLYGSLAGIVRFVGLSMLSDKQSHMPLSVIIDSPLDSVRMLISDLRMKEFNKESWKSWYARSNSGQLLRNASTAIRVLNEMIYGTSDDSIQYLKKLFPNNWSKIDLQENNDGFQIPYSSPGSKNVNWNLIIEDDVKENLVYCIGNILHEYLAPEIWGLPTEYRSFVSSQSHEEDPPLYLFHDATMLHQIIIDGIGIFSMSLGTSFKASGFMHNCLFLLLQKLICPNNRVKTACDAVLRIMSTVGGYLSVGNLIVENADYIVDSLCRNLRHLDIDPQIPFILSAILSFIGVAQEILPLLNEPLRIVSLELEVLGRHQNPRLTEPFLKALFEIAKASRFEACQVLCKHESFCKDLTSKVLEMKHTKSKKVSTSVPDLKGFAEIDTDYTGNAEFESNYWEVLFLKLSEMKRYRRIVGSVAGSCLNAAIPLIASKSESICLVALEIVENGCITLANVERGYELEKESKTAICDVIHFFTFKQEISSVADEADENRLLPAVNKIWPYLIICLKNKASVPVIQQCMHTINFIIQLSGGDFFIRRFRSDGGTIWQLLSCSPFQRKLLPQKPGRKIILPYRGAAMVEDSMAEVSTLKVQEAALNMIADIASNKKTSTALEAVFKKISGRIVGIACSNVVGLQDASMRALRSLATIDSDLIWLLVADIYYSLKKANIPHPPTSNMPTIHELLPPPSSSKDYIFLQYGGEGFGFDIDPLVVERIFERLQSEEYGE